MLEGKKVEINPKRFKTIGDRLLNNTLKKRNKLPADKGDFVLVEKSDKQWQAMLTK
jgi:hypothetical protein